MNAKENYLNALKKLPHEWVPVEGEGLQYTGFEKNQMEKGDFVTNLDGFGVKWSRPESGGGTALPEPGHFLLTPDNVCDWRDLITIPDASAYHWAEDAENQLAGVDRSTTAVDYSDGNGPFERLAALMGFEGALMAMALEPEAVGELLNAITDYKVAAIDHIMEHYHPDTYTLFDDCATQSCTFMSPAAYRELIKPCHKRIADKVKEYGVIPLIHCCGHAEALIEDFIEEGFAGWTSVQPCNDIAGLLKRYGGQICIAGGYSTNGRGATMDKEIMREEVERCFAEYADLPGYIFQGFILLAGGADNYSVWEATINMMGIAIERAHQRS